MYIQIQKDTNRIVLLDRNSKFNKFFFTIEDKEIYVYGISKNLIDSLISFWKEKHYLYQNNKIKFFNTLYTSLPGHYYCIITSSSDIQIITDVYALLKLYKYETSNYYFISDNHKDFLNINKSYSIDTEALKYFFLTNYTPSEHTVFKELKKLSPSTISTFRLGILKTESFIVLNKEKSFNGEGLVNEVYNDIKTVTSLYEKKFKNYNLFLSGGIDSSFLLKFLIDQGIQKDKLIAVTGAPSGLNQTFTTSNDYDVYYSQKLAAHYETTHEIIEYDFTGEQVLDDFLFLRDNLFNEYAPAFGYVGYTRAIKNGDIIFNGQNADSVFSFGGTGFPHINRRRLVGLAGVFNRQFQFFRGQENNILLRVLSRLLMTIYYQKNYKFKPNFTDYNYLSGMALNPSNFPYWEKDPIFDTIKDVDKLAEWMLNHYWKPIVRDYPNLSFHGLFQILYHRTYMQGSANRSTIYPALLNNKDIILPYAHLPILEKMILLKPNWKYVFYGKYPNYILAKNKLKIPKYIINRDDPPGCDDTTLIYESLLKNKYFSEFLFDNINETNWSIYQEVLSKKNINKIKNNLNVKNPNDLPVLMRFTWINTLIKNFN